MIQVGFNTVRDPRTTLANSNGTTEKARGTNLSLASDMTARLNGSSHQETAKVIKEDPSSDVAPTTSELAEPADEKQEQPSSNHATVNLAARVTTTE